MNSKNYYIPLNLPNISDELKLQEDIERFLTFNNMIWFTLGGHAIPNTAIDFFKKLGLTASKEKSILYIQEAQERHKIHMDSDNSLTEEHDTKYFRNFAVNWVWGGKTIMEWYNFRGKYKPYKEKFYDQSYLWVYNEDCRLLFKDELQGANLVNLDKYHTVYNNSPYTRYCLSVAPEENITYEEMAELCARKKGLIREI